MARHAGTLAALLCVGAVAGFAAALDEYSHLQHPVGLLGAIGMPDAGVFNLLAFVVPGVVGALLAVRLRSRLPHGARWPARIGCWMLAVSGVAFAAHGVLPLDVNALDGPVSQRHATAWLLWWVAFVPAAAALSAGLADRPGWRGFAWVQATLGVLVLLMVLVPTPWWPAPVSQRIATAAWLVAMIAAGRR